MQNEMASDNGAGDKLIPGTSNDHQLPRDVYGNQPLQRGKHPASRALEKEIKRELSAIDNDSGGNRHKDKVPLLQDAEDMFFDAKSFLPSLTLPWGQEMQRHSLDHCLEDLTWSQAVLLDEGAGEATVADDIGNDESELTENRTNESVVKLVQVLKYSQSDWNKMKQELELSFQAQLLAKEREWSLKLADRDARILTVEEGSKKLKQTNDDMRAVVAEFERTIAQLQSEKEKTNNATQQSLQDVLKERDQALEDLQSVETAFSDLHRRYEKTKSVMEGFKQNEEVLKKCVQELQTKLKKMEQKMQQLKIQAEEKLDRATEEIDKVQKINASDIARLEAALKKADLQIQSLENSLDQKIKENKELAAICDELIAKVQ
ncbi:transforming acidic coiled-coil-containing protein 3-like isoform X1 [Pomacea canaliculata]|uniref:transforming acidic coiled-coil-containing protein 3-like isoform X1 n=1 Tax=Pomacea canaliculata TaxID=400727 RepID=UPI000D72A77B|nr:transforming acidic coiled-coil-containing protein 3-like isoform X1 [Pomacea canaliculata]